MKKATLKAHQSITAVSQSSSGKIDETNRDWKVKGKSRKEKMQREESSHWVTFHEHAHKESTLEPTKPESTKLYFCTEGEFKNSRDGSQRRQKIVL